ncbi:hypothetical protein PUN28_009902 [Cardiocondyla obscurior]|uniref:RRM domain-containing protein n=1 Tax=Cardiocondyla obscurior TaxID=286306 RepID=A0AAW2FMC1_9HYME
MIANSFRKYAINIFNVPWTVGRYELCLYFSQFGYVTDIYVAFDKNTGLHQGYANLSFLRETSVNAVLERKHSLEGKDLIISRRIN